MTTTKQKLPNNFVALLRGINVGGNNIIKMEDLRKVFEGMGFDKVKTYIQSGNVLFTSEEKCRDILEQKIERVLSVAFSYTAKVLVRSQKDIEDTVSNFPKIFENSEWKHNVLFLTKVLDSKDILARFSIKEDIEHLSYHAGVLYWSAKLDTITRSTMIKLATRKEYKEMTVRNSNTTRKIEALLQE